MNKQESSVANPVSLKNINLMTWRIHKQKERQEKAHISRLLTARPRMHHQVETIH